MIIEAIIEIIAWVSGRSLKAGARRVPFSGRRIVAAVLAVVFGAYVVLGLVALVLTEQRRPGDFWLTLGLFPFPATLALLCAWFALRGDRPEPSRHMKTTRRGALILGGIGLAAGVIGPVVFSPDSNQGPLIGILFTGPLGFTLAAVIGWLYGRFRRPSVSASDGRGGFDVA